MKVLNAMALVAIALAAPAVAQPIQPYTTAAFAAAQRAGAPILVDVHADWCPTCRKQAPTIAALAHDPALARLVILKIDFDSQVPERTALGVNKQSTLIVFKGAHETARAIGTTDPQAIRALVATSQR